MKVFFTNLEFKNDVLLSSIKGVQMEINKRAWKDVVGLKPRGVQVRKGETGAVPEFNKMQYYGQCLRNPIAEIKHFHVGGLKVDQRLLGMIVTKILVPRGTNHSTLNEGDLILMSAYFCPHLMFNSGYLIEFVCLKIDLIEISYYWVY